MNYKEENLKALEGLNSLNQVDEFLRSIGIDENTLKFEKSEARKRDYIKNYGHFKVGDSVKLKAGEFSEVEREIVSSYTEYNEDLDMDVVDELREDEMYNELEAYDEFFRDKVVKIKSFYHLGAVELEGFDYGMELHQFEPSN